MIDHRRLIMATQGQKQDEPVGSPNTYAEYYRQGWALHAAGKQDAAEQSLRKAIELEPASVDAHFTLGLALKAQDRNREAVELFQKVLTLIRSGAVEHNIRSEMVRRLALGHINRIEKGDWDLEGEIWRKKDTPTENA
jgi:tetratricopeptide (TPR) repeat protein